MNGTDTCTLRFPVVAGALVRGQFRRFLDRQRFVQDQIGIDYLETKSLLESEFVVRVSGPRVLVQTWCLRARDFVRELDSGE